MNRAPRGQNETQRWQSVQPAWLKTSDFVSSFQLIALKEHCFTQLRHEMQSSFLRFILNLEKLFIRRLLHQE